MSEVLWIDQTGKKWRIIDMSCSHLKNTIMFLEKRICHYKELESGISMYLAHTGEYTLTCMNLENDQKTLSRIIRCGKNKKKAMETELMRR